MNEYLRHGKLAVPSHLDLKLLMKVTKELGLTDLARLINEQDVSTPGDPRMLEMLSGESAATVSPPASSSPSASTCSASSEASGSSSGQFFGNKNYDLVYGIIRQTVEELDCACDRDTVFNQAKETMSKSEVDRALDYLSSEGHIWTTIDEDHFKTTDGE